jgi:transposase
MSESYLGIDVHKKWCVFTEIDSMGKVRVIAESKSKTDRYDARMLAELLRTNFLPESWVPPAEIRWLRGLIRRRHHLVKTIVMNKNRIRHLLFQHGISLSVFNIASPKARPAIRGLCLPEMTRQTIDQCLKIIAILDDLVLEINKRIEESVTGNPTVELLHGKLRSAAIYGEMGDINRFTAPKPWLVTPDWYPLSGRRVIRSGLAALPGWVPGRCVMPWWRRQLTPSGSRQRYAECTAAFSIAAMSRRRG